MEELSKEDLERINTVLATYKGGFESGTIINCVLLNVDKPNKNEDVFEMPVKQDVQVFYDHHTNRDNNDSK